MDSIELAKKALKTIGTRSFSCWLYGGDWDTYEQLTMTEGELLYLINKEVGFDSAFEGFELVETDVESQINDMAREGAWPDGGPMARVNGVIPEELEDLSDDLEELDLDDEDAVNRMRERLKAIKGGDYTFSFDIVDGSYSYYFAEDTEEEIHLTAEEVLGLLLGEHGDSPVFDGICSKAFDEDLINDKAEKAGFADEHDNVEVGGRCEAIDQFVTAWGTLLDKIAEEVVTEENLDLWLRYFDDDNNLETDIEEWVEDEMKEE